MEDDERYIVIDGRRWRRSDPRIPEPLRKQLVGALMDARRAVGAAKRSDDAAALTAARARVQDAKVALGERGHPWWEEPDTQARRDRLAAAIRALLRRREAGKTICPSDAARVAGGSQWRDLMPLAREVAWSLADDGWLEVVQRGQPVDRSARGPLRLRRR